MTSPTQRLFSALLIAGSGVAALPAHGQAVAPSTSAGGVFVTPASGSIVAGRARWKVTPIAACSAAEEKDYDFSRAFVMSIGAGTGTRPGALPDGLVGVVEQRYCAPGSGNPANIEMWGVVNGSLGQTCSVPVSVGDIMEAKFRINPNPSNPSGSIMTGTIKDAATDGTCTYTAQLPGKATTGFVGRAAAGSGDDPIHPAISFMPVSVTASLSLDNGGLCDLTQCGKAPATVVPFTSTADTERYTASTTVTSANTLKATLGLTNPPAGSRQKASVK